MANICKMSERAIAQFIKDSEQKTFNMFADLSSALNYTEYEVTSIYNNLEKKMSARIKETDEHISYTRSECNSKILLLENVLSRTSPTIKEYYTDDNGETHSREVPNPRYDELKDKLYRARNLRIELDYINTDDCKYKIKEIEELQRKFSSMVNTVQSFLNQTEKIVYDIFKEIIKRAGQAREFLHCAKKETEILPQVLDNNGSVGLLELSTYISELYLIQQQYLISYTKFLAETVSIENGWKDEVYRRFMEKVNNEIYEPIKKTEQDLKTLILGLEHMRDRLTDYCAVEPKYKHRTLNCSFTTARIRPNEVMINITKDI